MFSPQGLALAAQALLGLGDETPGPGNDPVAESYRAFLREVRGRGGPIEHWDVAFLYRVGFATHFDHARERTFWPLPPVTTAQELWAFARLRGILVEEPEQGDIFLLYSEARKMYVRAGVVLDLDGEGSWLRGGPYRECVTIEGNTNEALGAGGQILRHSRKFSAKRGDWFVRWTMLAPCAPAGVRTPRCFRAVRVTAAMDRAQRGLGGERAA